MSVLDTAEYRRLALIAAGVDPCDIPCILDTAMWRRLMLQALYDLSQGGGGSPGYITGSVQFYADLPVTVGTPPVNTAYLVREDSGVWFINRKPAGIYVRLFNNGVLADWDYAGEFPSVNDSQYFRIYDSADPTKEIAFSASLISPGQTRTITPPDKNITLDDASDPRTPTAHTHGNLTNDGKIGTTANLPLKTGTDGVVEAGAFGTSAGSFCEGNDARLSDARTPSSTLAHAASHASGGTDALAPSDIGAQSIFARSSVDIPVSGPLQLSAARAAIISVSNGRAETRDVYLPMTSIQNGDIIVVVGGGTLTNPINIKVPAAGGAAIVDPNGGTFSISVTGQQYRFIVDGVGNFIPWTRVSVDTHTHELDALAATGIAAGKVLAADGDDGSEWVDAPSGGGSGEVRSDFVSPYTYTGLAAAGTSESTASWTIRRSEFDSGGSYVATTEATAVEWDDRLTASYA